MMGLLSTNGCLHLQRSTVRCHLTLVLSSSRHTPFSGMDGGRWGCKRPRRPSVTSGFITQLLVFIQYRHERGLFLTNRWEMNDNYLGQLQNKPADEMLQKTRVMLQILARQLHYRGICHEKKRSAFGPFDKCFDAARFVSREEQDRDGKKMANALSKWHR